MTLLLFCAEVERESDFSVGEKREEGKSVGKSLESPSEKPAEMREFLFLDCLSFGPCLLSFGTGETVGHIAGISGHQNLK